MEQIRIGLENGLDVDQYADPKLNAEEMAEIQKGLKKEKQKEPEMKM